MSAPPIDPAFEEYLSSFLAHENPGIPLLVINNSETPEFLEALAKIGQQRDWAVSRFLSTSDCQKTYGPLLEWMLDRLRNLPANALDEILNRARVYSFHRPLLKQLIERQPLNRHEELFFQEIDFERQCLLNSLSNLLLLLTSQSPRFFIIGQAHLLPHSAFALLKRLWKKSTQRTRHPFRIILLYREIAPEGSDIRDSKFLEFLQLAESHGHLIRREGLSVSDVAPQEITHSRQDAHDALELLALQDAGKCLVEILSRHTSGEEPLEIKDHLIVLEDLGKVHFLDKQYDLAMSYWQTALSLAQQLEDKKDIARLLVRVGHVFFEKRNLDHARHLADQAKNIAREYGDEVDLFHALFLEFFIQDKLRSQSLEEFRHFYTDLLLRAKKLGFFNRLSFLATNPFGHYSDFSHEFEAYHAQGLALARMHGNIYRLAYAYQTAGLVESVRGNYRQTISYYLKSLRLKKKLRNSLELAYINNGIGFYHYMTGDYLKAHQHYLQAIRQLRKAKNFEEIGMTLFNLAVNALLAFEFEETVTFIRICLELIRTLGLPHLSYHSHLGLQVVLGTAYALDQQYTRAWQVNLYIESQHLKPFPRKNEEYFLQHFLKALLDGNPEDWERAEYFLYEPNDNIQYLAPFFYTHQGDYYRNFISLEAAEIAWNKGLEHARKSENLFYRQILETRLSGQQPRKSPLGLPKSRAGWSWILAAARLQKQLVTIHEQFEEIQFVNTFQSVITQCVNLDEMGLKAGSLLFQNGWVKAVYLGQVIKGKIGILYQSGPIAYSHPYLSALLSSILGLGKRSGNRLPQFREPIPSIWANFGYWSHHFHPSPETTVYLLCLLEPENDESLTKLYQTLNSLAAFFENSWIRQVQEGIIRDQLEDLKRKNLLLEKTSTTDHLTAVGNRHALTHTLKKEMARFNRSRKESPPLSILFLDLDNFKFFNDNFGHTVGDRILYLSARLLETEVRTTDLVFRYGGDEFVIVLPETDARGANELANRIVEKFRLAGSFQTELELDCGIELLIPEDKHLSCSIGVATYDGEPEKHTDIQILLNQADNRLYQAKVQGKSQAV